MFLKGICAAMK